MVGESLFFHMCGHICSHFFTFFTCFVHIFCNLLEFDSLFVQCLFFSALLSLLSRFLLLFHFVHCYCHSFHSSFTSFHLLFSRFSFFLGAGQSLKIRFVFCKKRLKTTKKHE